MAEARRGSRHVVKSSGNVFVDLRLSNAVERNTKVRLAVTINQIIRESALSQSETAQRLGVSQPKVSALANYRLDGFSVERLMNFLNALGRDVEIVIRRPKAGKRAGIQVTAA
jgi:predicted XRE-type DNA-binding protein